MREMIVGKYEQLKQSCRFMQIHEQRIAMGTTNKANGA